MKFFIGLVIGGIIFVIGVGLWVIGSPQQERARRFDELRIGHLQQIQYQIFTYYQYKQRLPDVLSDLNVQSNGFELPHDPQTGKEYEYSKKTDTDFELCGVFSASQNENSQYYPKFMPLPPMPTNVDYNWKHEKGHVCFNRTIDKDFLQKTPLK